MWSILTIYGINGVSFLANFIAVLIYWRLAGASGYGTYGIYVTFSGLYLLVDFAVVKTAIVVCEDARASVSEDESQSKAVSFIRWAILPIFAASIVVVFAGNLLFPAGPNALNGGAIIALIAYLEHLSAYPSNRLTFHLTDRKQYREVFVWRLAGTLLRHVLSLAVLLVTGSVLLAVSMSVVRGVIFGLCSSTLIKKNFALLGGISSRPSLYDFRSFAGLFGASLSLIIMYEMVTVFIDHVYGRETLGSYRILFDVTNPIWFIATIYPTLLFTHLLPEHGKLNVEIARTKFESLSPLLALLHACYFFCFGAAYSFARYYGILKLDQIPFAVGVVGGIALLGYNRFLIEAGQAYGRQRETLISAVVTIVVAAALLIFLSRGERTEIGLAWIVGQAIFFICLKASIGLSLGNQRSLWRDLWFLTIPCLIAFALEARTFIGEQVLIFSIGAAASAVYLFMLLQRLRHKMA